MMTQVCGAGTGGGCRPVPAVRGSRAPGPGTYDGMTSAEQPDPDRLLATYLQDHRAGAAAGLALAQRCARSNEGTALGDVLTEIAREIDEDRQALDDIMGRLDVSESQLKSLGARAGELVGRVKTNGVLTGYSPSSRVVELEGLLAGVSGKRRLWASLSATASTRSELDEAELRALFARATSQIERLEAEHDRAAASAFARAGTTP